MNDINEQYLNKSYEDFSKEQMNLMTAMKSGGTEDKYKELDIQKQLTQINALMISLLRFRNLRKKIEQRANSI